MTEKRHKTERKETTVEREKIRKENIAIQKTRCRFNTHVEHKQRETERQLAQHTFHILFLQRRHAKQGHE